MEGARRTLLPDGRRWHFQHGPIDLVLEAFGGDEEVSRAYEQAWACFPGVLPALAAELHVLRSAVGRRPPEVDGPTAVRMGVAVWPHRRSFVTPMAAVAGAVADEVLAAMVDGVRLGRAYVNNGGDIALYLASGQALNSGIVTNPSAPHVDGALTISFETPVRGIATSGRSGRSFSLGIADSVTVLARDAASADVAATLIANAVDADHDAIRRVPASHLDPDSDLGDRPVTVEVGAIDDTSIGRALDSGADAARAMRSAGLIEAALLSLRGQFRGVSEAGLLAPSLRSALSVGESRSLEGASPCPS